eukprot:CAMPEP_0172923106 /NCGR_PEP_ID=MMETSP1075-20121228/209136_1 /TAXON_ID=2916 /ORGANISM="Ceratium fusus, Strain PA161109" /LENGTH=70 /DNA_ID=CAMNT_0013783531 /DNA_START=950 /DNA_END=1162 /DNA_ORIENTATION=+
MPLPAAWQIRVDSNGTVIADKVAQSCDLTCAGHNLQHGMRVARDTVNGSAITIDWVGCCDTPKPFELFSA